MKRSLISLVALGLSTSIFAAFPGATDPTVINIPQLPGGLVLGVSGFYLDSSFNNGNLEYTRNISIVEPNQIFQGFAHVSAGYDWGWGVNFGYIFSNTGNDVNVNYWHYDAEDGDGTEIAFNPNFMTSVAFGNNPYQAAAARAEYALDQIDGSFGQYINVGCRVVLHPYAGVRWVDMDNKLTTVFGLGLTDNTGTVFTFFQNESAVSDYMGAGPLAGLDGSYYLFDGIGLVAHVDGAITAGDAKTSLAPAITDTTIINSNIVASNTSIYQFTADYRVRMVPVVDAKGGINYTYLFNNTNNSAITFEVGYQTSNYFNPFDRIFANSVTSYRNRSTTDWGLYGPYLNATFHV